MNEITKKKPKYYFLRRMGIFLVLLTVTSLIYTNTALNGNAAFADVSLIVLVVVCFGLRHRER